MIVECARMYRVAFFDPRGANPNTKTNSRASLACVGMDDLERIFILQTWAAFSGVDDQVNKVFRFHQKWEPQVFAVDTTATQNLWINILSKEMEIRGVRPKFRYITMQTNKRRVIETILQPRASKGQLFRPPEKEVRELKSEWVSFPGGVYRDSLDALAHAVDLLPLRPPDTAGTMERESFQRYLERTGASREEVRQRMREIG